MLTSAAGRPDQMPGWSGVERDLDLHRRCGGTAGRAGCGFVARPSPADQHHREARGGGGASTSDAASLPGWRLHQLLRRRGRSTGPGRTPGGGSGTVEAAHRRAEGVRACTAQAARAEAVRTWCPETEAPDPGAPCTCTGETETTGAGSRHAGPAQAPGTGAPCTCATPGVSSRQAQEAKEAAHYPRTKVGSTTSTVRRSGPTDGGCPSGAYGESPRRTGSPRRCSLRTGCSCAGSR